MPIKGFIKLDVFEYNDEIRKQVTTLYRRRAKKNSIIINKFIVYVSKHNIISLVDI